YGLACIEARDTVELGLDERGLERPQSPLRPGEQRGQAALHPGMHVGHGAELMIERRNVSSRPCRYERTISSSKEVIVQVAFGNAPDRIEIGSGQGINEGVVHD